MLVRTVVLFHETSKVREAHKVFYRRITHNVPLEIAWTLIPTILLCNIIVASFSVLYSLEELHEPQITVKVIGHQ